ncbi:tetratricopeptide repeat protein [bacterium]|nr:tetratricopeptide repeat protein [bacterium]
MPMAGTLPPLGASPAGGVGFGNIDLSAPVVPGTVPPAVPIDDGRDGDDDGTDIMATPGVRRVADILAQSDPTRDEKDDDGCFEIDSGEDLEALVSEALAKSKLRLVDPARPAPPAEPAATGRDRGNDRLSRLLNEAPTGHAGDRSAQLETITAEIGAVVGGSGQAADAERMYEMGLVYLEMGLYDQACGSFQTAAADDAFAARAHEMWGITLQRAGRLPEAISALRAGLARAAEGSRELHGLRYHLGRALEQAGRADEAAECYREIRAADPAFLDVGQRLKRLVVV